jgi:hypothetical protein
VNLIKQSTQQRGEGRTKREDPGLSQKCKNPNGVSKEQGINYVLEPPQVLRDISEKERKEILKE